MGTTIKKEPKMPKAEELKHKVSESAQDLDPEDQFRIVRKLCKQAAKTALNYNALKEEMEDYDIALPENPDIVNISELNQKYALAQAALSRVTAIEMLAIDNYSRWCSIMHRMEGYIDTRRGEILLRDDVSDLKVRQQDATVRKEMSKDYKYLYKIKEKVNAAESFLNVTKVKKKDLASIITNISRQVKVLSLDYEISNKHLG